VGYVSFAAGRPLEYTIWICVIITRQDIYVPRTAERTRFILTDREKEKRDHYHSEIPIQTTVLFLSLDNIIYNL
jgi:hypothetical protein